MSYSRFRAFSLIEVVLALGIISFALTALIGLLSVGYRSGQESVDRTDTALLSDDIISQLRAKPFDVTQEGQPLSNSPSTVVMPPLPALNVPATAPDFFVDADNKYIGSDKGNRDAVKGVRIKVSQAPDEDAWSPAGLSGNSSGIAFVRIEIFWPPAAPVGKQQKIVYTTEISSVAQGYNFLNQAN